MVAGLVLPSAPRRVLRRLRLEPPPRALQEGATCVKKCDEVLREEGGGGVREAKILLAGCRKGACRGARSRQRNHPLFRCLPPFTPPSILCAARLKPNWSARARAHRMWLPVWFSQLVRAFLPNRMGNLEEERGRRRERKREGSPVRLSSSELRLPVYSDDGLF